MNQPKEWINPFINVEKALKETLTDNVLSSYDMSDDESYWEIEENCYDWINDGIYETISAIISQYIDNNIEFTCCSTCNHNLINTKQCEENNCTCKECKEEQPNIQSKYKNWKPRKEKYKSINIKTLNQKINNLKNSKTTHDIYKNKYIDEKIKTAKIFWKVNQALKETLTDNVLSSYKMNEYEDYGEIEEYCYDWINEEIGGTISTIVSQYIDNNIRFSGCETCNHNLITNDECEENNCTCKECRKEQPNIQSKYKNWKPRKGKYNDKK